MAAIILNEALEIERLNARLRELRVLRFIQRVQLVDVATFHEALELLGESWELRSFARFRSALAYTARVELPPVDLRQYLAGADAWNSDHVTYAITEAGRAALSQPACEETDDE